MALSIVNVMVMFAATASCPALECEYKCVASPSGGACACAAGLALAADNRSCSDRDECKDWGYCHQLCVNTPGCQYSASPSLEGRPLALRVF